MLEFVKNPKNKKWVICGVVYAIALLLILLIANLDAFNDFLSATLTILRPVLIGLVLAYFCNPLFRLFERKLFFKVRPITLRRVLSLIFTYIVVFLIILFFFMLLIPQLVSSILSFLDNYDTYMSTVVKQLNDLIFSINQNLAQSGEVISYIDENAIKQSISNFFDSIDGEMVMYFLKLIDLETVGTFLEDLFSIVIDVIVGFFISVYLLHTKEKRYAQIMRMRKALFTDAFNQRATKLISTANRSFGGFFRGKLLDSFIIAILIYIAISIFGIEYPLLIATIIGVTDIIPIIGPIIGVFPAGFIILLSQPEKLIPFIIIVILVQQLDGNIISPKILGENTGVSSLCVIIAIATMGTLWGFAGMVLGVPLFATVLELSDAYFEKRLKAKGRPSSTEEYYQSDSTQEHGNKAQKKSKFFKRYERKMLQLRQEALVDGGIGDLTRLEKLQLETYSLARKYNIFSEFTEESLAQFAAEEAAIAATVDPEKIEDLITPDSPDGEAAESNHTKSQSKGDPKNDEQ